MGFFDFFKKLNWSEKWKRSKPQFDVYAEKTMTGLRELPTNMRKIMKKEFWTNLTIEVKNRFPKNVEELRNLKPEELLASLFGSKSKDMLSNKAVGSYIRMSFVAFAAYFLADTVSLFTESLIPDPPAVPAPRITKKQERSKSIEQYSQITDRNIFSSKGLIPEDQDLASGPARKSTLPLHLVGTVVLHDELKSIATIEDKSQNMVFPIRVDEAIEGKIKVTKIEHLKVYFINQSTGYPEYIEIIDDVPLLNVSALQTSTTPKNDSGITQLTENKFEIEKNFIEKSLNNMGAILQQARAVPNLENGVPNGFRLLQIEKGSIFDKFGLKENDVLDCVNGEPLNDPGKAFQLFNEIRTISHLELCVKRGGKKMVMSYDVR